MNEDRFLAIVQRESGRTDDQAVPEAVRAVLETLSERLMAGPVNALRRQLPPAIARHLAPERPHELFGADEFLRRVAERSGTDLRMAERYTTAVFVALSRALDPDDFASVLAELGKDFRPLTEKARRPASQPTEFLRRVADRSGLDEEAALRASEAVLEALAERISGGEADDLMKQLPRILIPALERGKQRSGEQARKMNLDEFLSLIAEREGTTPEQAREHAAAVLTTLRDAVTSKEFHDLISELPRSYVEELTTV